MGGIWGVWDIKIFSSILQIRSVHLPWQIQHLLSLKQDHRLFHLRLLQLLASAPLVCCLWYLQQEEIITAIYINIYWVRLVRHTHPLLYTYIGIRLVSTCINKVLMALPLTSVYVLVRSQSYLPPWYTVCVSKVMVLPICQYGCGFLLYMYQ